MRGGDGADDAGAQGGGLPDDRSLSAGRQEGEGRLLDELVALSGHSRRYAAALGYTGHERMHQREDDMLKIWGRADGSNVIKAMWCIGELGIAHERIDWGGEFGGNDDPVATGGEVENAIDHQRRALVSVLVFISEDRRAFPLPGDLESRDVGGVDLRQRGVA